MSRLSIPKEALRVVLLEGVHANAADAFRAAGYTTIESFGDTPDEHTLGERIAGAHIVGIRSRTRLPADVLAAAERLFCIGCFCIGTNQVDVQAAKMLGIPVFNAPYSNTRSVAELVIGEIIMLFRRVPERTAQVHRGEWNKTAEGASEVRGKTLGIVGYGHIGTQVSVLAEALGMRVVFYDIVDKLVIGNARPCASLDQVLTQVDVVSLHVPATPATRGMIGESELARMRPGAFLINAARGSIVEVNALAAAIRSGHVAGAALDVFPDEPAGNDAPFASPLQGLPNVILTPHVGGSTREAQANIGSDVAEKLVRYSDNGSTVGAVNFVEVSLPVQQDRTRFLHIHANVPGVLSAVNDVFARRNLNLAAQYLRTDADIGYVVTEVEGRLESGMGIRRDLQAIPGTIRTRFMF